MRDNKNSLQFGSGREEKKGMLTLQWRLYKKNFMFIDHHYGSSWVGKRT